MRVEQPMAFRFAKPSPDAVWLLDGKCMRAAPVDDRTAGAEGFGCFLAALAAHAALGIGREESPGIDLATQSFVLPVIGLHDWHRETLDTDHDVNSSECNSTAGDSGSVVIGCPLIVALSPLVVKEVLERVRMA